MPEKKTLSLSNELGLTDEQFLDLHLELARLEISHVNLRAGDLPKLPEALQKRFLQHIMSGNIKPSPNKPKPSRLSDEFEAVLERAANKGALLIGGSKDEKEIFERYVKEYNEWHKKVCLTALKDTEDRIAQARDKILTGGNNLILEGNLRYDEVLRGQIELFFDHMKWWDIPPRARRPQEKGIEKEVPSEAELEPQPSTEEDREERFNHSPDYSTVKIQGKSFNLTPPQAHVIRMLHDEYQERGADGRLSRSHILDSVEGAYVNRVREIFRTNRPAYKELVQYIDKPRGHYRLKL